MSEHAQSSTLAASRPNQHEHEYLPGMGVDWLLPIYDPVTRLLGLRSLHDDLAKQADIQPGQRALEVGCGTGNLALVLKRHQPDADIVGLDPDPRALTRARRKAARARLALQFDCGFAEQLPYPDGSFEHVFSAFMFHHLEPGGRRVMLEEANRVLRPGGSLHLLDFGGHVQPSDGLMARLSARSQRLRENLGDSIPEMMRQSGLDNPAETASKVIRVGRCTSYRAIAGAGAMEDPGQP